MFILGLNAYHGDSAACLVRGKDIIAAAEEERFRRVKHWAGFPSEAISYCLAEARIELNQIDAIAINSNPRVNYLAKVRHILTKNLNFSFLLDRLNNQARRQAVQSEMNKHFPNMLFRGEVIRVEHHLSHLASAFLVSPFKDACVASIDGFGDFSSAAWGVGVRTSIHVEDRVHFPHSLGIFYQALTQYLGFPHYGDEYKVMGLAPYGSPDMLFKMRQIVKLKENGKFELDLRYFRHHKEKIDYAWDGGSPHVGKLYTDALIDLLGPAREDSAPLEQHHKNIARSVQAMYEEAFFHIINHLYEKHRIDRLAVAGGCAMNSVANGKVLRRSPFKRLYVQAAAGDAGGAIGAAMYAWHQLNKADTNKMPAEVTLSCLNSEQLAGRTVMDHAYLGPSFSNTEIQNLINSSTNEIESAGCKFIKAEDELKLCQLTAEAISRGEVVGWFQGRMEWGPRALGNRSIVCDPRRADIKDILNLKIKRRESFRPFAPSILKEYQSEWFEEDGDVPFMMQVYQIHEDKRELIPAVTHVDGSGRLQSVYKETNKRYWMLIDAFRKLTGVPMVLNTSFNENEPIVCKPEEALDCFLRTNMDVLVLGNFYIVRNVI